MSLLQRHIAFSRHQPDTLASILSLLQYYILLLPFPQLPNDRQ